VKPKPILIIEDEAALAAALATLVRRLGHEAVTAASAELGLERLREQDMALVILDIGLPDMSGLEALARIRAGAGALPVLIVTAHGNLQNAVEAKRRGASAYLVKPLDLRELEQTLRALLVPPAPAAAGEPYAELEQAPFLVGTSPAMQPAFAAIAHATASDVPVLITGPTGIGKSLTARVIHLHSARREGPFVTLACGSLPEALLEAELFGHEKGAFTGAIMAQKGHLERAASGTLFLDEIGEVPPSVQVKLLRFLDDRVYTRVGGREDLQVDLRIIAASNQDLNEAVAARRFREDLLYRLRVLEVKLPPLRERMADLPTLCNHLLARSAAGRRLHLSADALSLLQAYSWPGNVRELRNALEHATAVCGGPMILPVHLPAELRNGGRPAGGASIDAVLDQWIEERLRTGANYDALHDELEGKLLAALLPRYAGKPTLLARALDMNRATLRKKLRGMQGMPDDPDEGEPLSP
jgi:DNA-binding NtrC family response regulator